MKRPSTRKQCLSISMWHGDLCHICGKTMLFTNRGGFLRATLDHLVPKSKGGKDTEDNLLLAHRLCNERRGDSPLNDLIRDKCELAMTAFHLFDGDRHLVRTAVFTQFSNA